MILPEIIKVPPQFAVNFNVGWVGWTLMPCWESELIAYGERWTRGKLPSVSHTFIVTSALTCMEAHYGTGVNYGALHDYFTAPGAKVYFRKPAGWTPAIGDRIAEAATQMRGLGYGSGLILAEAAADSYVGHFINKVFHQWPNRLISQIFSDFKREICSELVAYALDKQGEYHGRGVLQNPLDCIDPQELFGDDAIFEPTIYDCSPDA